MNLDQLFGLPLAAVGLFESGSSPVFYVLYFWQLVVRRQFLLQILYLCLALSDAELHGLLIPRVPCRLLQRRAGQINVTRLAVLLRANIDNLHLDRAPGSLHRRALATRPSGLLEISLVQRRIVRVPLAETPRVEPAGITSGTVHLRI